MNISEKIDYIDKDGNLDIYAFMRSDVIREYLRKNKVFSTLEKARIICFSFYPVEIKIGALKALAYESDGEDRELIESSIKLMEKVLSIIYEPGEKVLYSVTPNYSSGIVQDAMRENGYAPVEYYYSYKDFVKDNTFYREDLVTDDEFDYTNYFCIDIIPFKNKGYENPYIITFKATYFDGGIKVYDFYVDEIWAELCGFNESVIDLTSGFNLYSIGRYSLPFVHNERIKIKTPFMKNALNGVLNSKMDFAGCWYHFFNYDDVLSERGVGCLDLSYHELGFSTNLSVFDWIYPAEFELSENLKKEIESDDDYFYANKKSITEITEECSASLVCRVKRAILGNDRNIDVVLEDDSGIVEGQINLFEDDKYWILDIANNKGEIGIKANFIKKRDGKVYIKEVYGCFVLSRDNNGFADR